MSSAGLQRVGELRGNDGYFTGRRDVTRFDADEDLHLDQVAEQLAEALNVGHEDSGEPSSCVVEQDSVVEQDLAKNVPADETIGERSGPPLIDCDVETQGTESAGQSGGTSAQADCSADVSGTGLLSLRDPTVLLRAEYGDVDDVSCQTPPPQRVALDENVISIELDDAATDDSGSVELHPPMEHSCRRLQTRMTYQESDDINDQVIDRIIRFHYMKGKQRSLRVPMAAVLGIAAVLAGIGGFIAFRVSNPNPERNNPETVRPAHASRDSLALTRMTGGTEARD